MSLTKTTVSVRTEDAQQTWYVVDLQGVVLGRAATRIATILRGKHKPQYTPHNDTGDFVVVINAAGVALTGNKADKKIYYRHTGWFGGLKTEPAKRLVSRKPDDALRLAVKGMLPKGPLGRSMLSKLKVYAGPDHPHQAQAPVALELKV